MTQDHSYDGDLLTAIDSNSIVWDDNGSMVAGIGTSITRDPESRIRSATAGGDSIDCVYDPDGCMIRKTITVDGSSTTEKYIVDGTGPYPIILLLLDPNDAIRKSYVHANGETLVQHDGDQTADRYFYLHDRLGSVRLLLDTSGDIANAYTYDPWGNAFPSETNETVGNELRFANYRWDDTVGMYYLTARWYDPAILRFTGRDPVRGRFQEPLSLHAYLYCVNDPLDRRDPSGRYAGYDDLAFAVAGALCGLVSQVASDVIAWELSGASDYVGSIVGGAASGWVSLYNPPAAGAVGGALSTLITESWDSLSQFGNLSGVDMNSVIGNAGLGGLFGLLPGPKRIPIISKGRGSFGAVAKQMVTKMSKGLINRFTSKTFAKIMVYEMTLWATMVTMDSSIDGLSRRFQNEDQQSGKDPLSLVQGLSN